MEVVQELVLEVIVGVIVEVIVEVIVGVVVEAIAEVVVEVVLELVLEVIVEAIVEVIVEVIVEAVVEVVVEATAEVVVTCNMPMLPLWGALNQLGPQRRHELESSSTAADRYFILPFHHIDGPAPAFIQQGLPPPAEYIADDGLYKDQR